MARTRRSNKGLPVEQEAVTESTLLGEVVPEVLEDVPALAEALPSADSEEHKDDVIIGAVVEEVETRTAPDAPAHVKIPVDSKRIASVEGKIRPVAEVENDFLTILGYGLNGTGKTTFGATAKRALFVDMEHGLKSVRHTSALHYPVNEWADVEALYWYLAGQPGGKHPDIDTLVWDTLTRLLRVAIRNAALGEAEKDPTKDLMNPSIRDWGTATERIVFWISAFKKLPYHQIWLCQERTTSDDVDVTGFLGFPDLSRALRGFIQGDADVIGRFEKRMDEEGKVHFIFNVAPSDMYVTRDRLNVLGNGMKNPKFETMLRLFREGGNK